VDLWREHFRALQEAVALTFNGKPGHPAPAYLLELVHDMAGVFAMLMDEKEHRDFYLDKGGPSWLRTYQPCPWDWETMAPALQVEKASVFEGPRPSHLEEAASWMALSKGLVWVHEGGKKRAGLLHGLGGVIPFPKERPPYPSWEEMSGAGSVKPLMVHATDYLAWDLGSALGLGSPEEGPWALLSTASTYRFILPQEVRIGGGFTLFAPNALAPFDEDLAKLLGVGSGVWDDLHLKGETQGHPWEVSFGVICGGLELSLDTKEARWVFDIFITWGPKETRESRLLRAKRSQDPEALTPGSEPEDTKRQALGWDEEDWTEWMVAIQSAIQDALPRLRGEGTKLEAHGVATSTATADLTEGPDSCDATATVEGVSALATVGPVFAAVGEVGSRPVSIPQEPTKGKPGVVKFLPVTLIQGPTREDRKAKALVRGLFGLGISKDILKAPRWDELVERETETLIQEATANSEDPDKPRDPASDPRLRVERDHRGNESLVLSSPARRALRERAGARGFVEARKDKDGTSSEWVVKRLRHGGGYAEVSFSWYSLASYLIPQARKKEKEELEEKLRKSLSEGTPLPFGALEVEDQEKLIKGLDHLRNTDNASILAEVIQREFGRTGAFPVVIPDANFRHALQLEKDPNGHAKVEAALNALQKLHFDLAITGDSELAGHAFGPFVGVVAWDPKLMAWAVELSPFAIGSLNVFKVDTIKRDGLRQAFTFDFMKELKDEEVKTLSYDQSPTSLAPFFYSSHGFTETQKRLFNFLESNLTKNQDATKKGREPLRITKKTHPEWGKPRAYRGDFCPLIPEGQDMVGFLGWKKDSRYAESGWKLWGTPGRATDTSGAKAPSLLHAMGVELPAGAGGNRRNALTKKALEDIEAVVVQAMGGIVATQRPNGQWQTLAQAKLLPADETGKKTVFYLFAPLDWVDLMSRHHIEVSAERGVQVNITGSAAVALEGFQEAIEGTTLETEPLQNRLASTRKGRKLTQGQVGALFGVSQSMVAQWEKGAKAIPARLSAVVQAWIETGAEPPKE
jgi:DNA-binding transcriptional regulator YiaG